MAQAQSAQPGRRHKIVGTFVSEESHPHLFAAYPALRERAQEGGGKVLMNDDTLREFEGHSRSKGARPGGSPAPWAHLPASAHGGEEYAKLFSPAALDRMRGGPPKIECTERQVDDWFAARRAARDATAARRS